MFRVGQKVVMIRRKSGYSMACGGDEYGWPSCINVGGIYTIRDVETRADRFGWPVMLRFEEFIADTCDLGFVGLGIWELGFPGDCFRPVVDRSTDISIFQAMLNPKKQTTDNRLDSALHDHGFDPPRG
jgi:hypothetical protein